jgi:excisionase family DNA binding protein
MQAVATREDAARDLSALPLLMTTSEVAAVLGVSARTVWNLRRDKRLPVVHVGRAVRFSRNYIVRLLAEGSIHAED